MNTVIYNPNNIDSVLSAAMLQTMGWTAFSVFEKVDVTSGRFLWLGVLPTKKHIEKQKAKKPAHYTDIAVAFQNFLNSFKRDAVKPSPKAVDRTEHICFVKNGRAPSSGHLLLKDVTYANEVVSQVKKDIFVSSKFGTSLLDQVSALANINTSERHFLNYLVNTFYQKDLPLEILAIATLNVVTALECLKTREPFTPINIPEKGKLTESFQRGMDLVQQLRRSAEKVLDYAALYDDTESSSGHKRVIRTYEKENWWFIRRLFHPADLAFNINVSSTGTFVDATVLYEFELGVHDPVVVAS